MYIYSMPCADVNTSVYQKIIKFRERIPQKTARGDNWPAAITGRLASIPTGSDQSECPNK